MNEVRCEKQFSLPSGEKLDASCVIPGYTGLPVQRQEIVLGHNEVELELQRRCVSHGRYLTTDQPAMRGDMVNLDFLGSLDGEAFDDGKITGYQLKLGSNTFLKEFEEQIMGHSAGESFSIDVTFPEQYPAEELCGRTARFDITLNEVQHLTVPKPSDEIAREEGFRDLAEMTKRVEEQRTQLHRAKQDARLQKQILEHLIQNAHAEIPEELLNHTVGLLREHFMADLSRRGQKLERFLRWNNMTEDALQEKMRQRAVDLIIRQLVVDTIARRERLEPTDKEVEQALERRKKTQSHRSAYNDAQMTALLRERMCCERVERFLLEQSEEHPWVS